VLRSSLPEIVRLLSVKLEPRGGNGGGRWTEQEDQPITYIHWEGGLRGDLALASGRSLPRDYEAKSTPRWEHFAILSLAISSNNYSRAQTQGDLARARQSTCTGQQETTGAHQGQFGRRGASLLMGSGHKNKKLLLARRQGGADPGRGVWQ